MKTKQRIEYRWPLPKPRRKGRGQHHINKQRETRRKIEKLVKTATEPMTVSKLASKSGSSRRIVRKHLAYMEREGLLELKGRLIYWRETYWKTRQCEEFFEDLMSRPLPEKIKIVNVVNKILTEAIGKDILIQNPETGDIISVLHLGFPPGKKRRFTHS